MIDTTLSLSSFVMGDDIEAGGLTTDDGEEADMKEKLVLGKLVVTRRFLSDDAVIPSPELVAAVEEAVEPGVYGGG